MFSPTEEKATGRPPCGLSILTGTCKKDGERVFSRACCNRARGSGFKLKEGRFRADIRKTFFYAEGGETPAQVALGGGSCPIPGNTDGQAGRGSEQSDVVAGGPAHCRGGWARWPLKVPRNPNHSVML